MSDVTFSIAERASINNFYAHRALVLERINVSMAHERDSKKKQTKKKRR